MGSLAKAGSANDHIELEIARDLYFPVQQAQSRRILLTKINSFTSQIGSLNHHWTCVHLCLKVDLPSTPQEISTIDEHCKLQEVSRHHEEKNNHIDVVQKYMVAFAKIKT